MWPSLLPYDLAQHAHMSTGRWLFIHAHIAFDAINQKMFIVCCRFGTRCRLHQSQEHLLASQMFQAHTLPFAAESGQKHFPSALLGTNKTASQQGPVTSTIAQMIDSALVKGHHPSPNLQLCLLCK